jgi:uncharacterized protein (TIGR00255 family)
MKLSSMTGYGEASRTLEISESSQVAIRVLCKSVNHRFLDLSVKLPNRYSHIEFLLQKIVRNTISRGRVEVSILRETLGQEASLEINKDLIESTLKTVSDLKIPNVKSETLIKSTLNALLLRKEVLDLSTKDNKIEDEVSLVEELLKEALKNLKVSREQEGEALFLEINRIISDISSSVSEIDRLSLIAPSTIKARFEERLQQLYANYNNEDSRMLQEIAILSDKVDIREEIVRLKSHLEHFSKVLLEGGRKLEFIVQEMGREINTIGSKTVQIEVSSLVIKVKSNLEKLREQLQNIE